MLEQVEWGEFKLKDLFEIVGTKSLDSNAIDFKENWINFIWRTYENNGIQGKIDQRDFAPNEPYTITATVIWNYKYVKYQKEPYYCSQNINKLTPKKIITTWSENIAYYFIANIQKFVSLYDNQQGWYKLDDMKNHVIKLPVKIDFNFMDKFIAELEAEHQVELEAYLKTTWLKDYNLTDDELKALNDFEEWKIDWKNFKIWDLFNKLNLKFLKGKFDKSGDVSMEQDSVFSLPLVNAKYGNNWIMYYWKLEDFESAEMTIDIVNDWAVSTWNVYPQPQRTWVLYNAYLIKPLFKASKLLLYFFSSTIQKSIKLKFSYENKAWWDKVKKEDILVPIKNNQPDYYFMETFISAIQKLVIKDVVIYNQQRLKATADVISK